MSEVRPVIVSHRRCKLPMNLTHHLPVLILDQLHRLTDEHPEQKDHATEQPETLARLHAMHKKWMTEVTR